MQCNRALSLVNKNNTQIGNYRILLFIFQFREIYKHTQNIMECLRSELCHFTTKQCQDELNDSDILEYLSSNKKNRGGAQFQLINHQLYETKEGSVSTGLFDKNYSKKQYSQDLIRGQHGQELKPQDGILETNTGYFRMMRDNFKAHLG